MGDIAAIIGAFQKKQANNKQTLAKA